MADQAPEHIPPYTPGPQPQEVDAVAEWFRRWMGASSIRKRDREYAGEVMVIVEPLVAARVRARVSEEIAHAIETELTGSLVCAWTRAEAALIARDHATHDEEAAGD